MRETESKWKKKVVYIYLDMSNSGDMRVAEKLGNTSATTIQFRDKNGKLVKQISGIHEPEYINKMIKKIVN